MDSCQKKLHGIVIAIGNQIQIMVLGRDGVFGFHHFELFDLAFPKRGAKQDDGELGDFIALNQGIGFKEFIEGAKAAGHNDKSYGVFKKEHFSNEEVFNIDPYIEEGVGFLFKGQFDVYADGGSADVFCASAGRFHHTGSTAGYHIKTRFCHACTHFSGLVVVFVVFFESRGTKNGDARSLKVKASKSFDELKENAEGEGEFGESTSGPLVDA